MSGAQPARSVLIVDDNAAMRALLRSLAEGTGSVVHECANAERAVAMYEQIHPDCVLMDVKMKGTDGITATRAIRRSDPHAWVIVVTEHHEEEYRRAATAAGASGFVPKERLLDLRDLLARDPRDARDTGGAP